MKQWSWFFLLGGLALSPPAAGSAQTRYTIQPLVKAGDTIGPYQIPPLGGNFAVLGLDDTGRLDFLANTSPDDTNPRTAMVEDDSGRFTPLFRGGDSLGDLQSLTFDVPAGDVNSSGQAVFALVDSSHRRTFVQYSAGKLSVIATEGATAPGGGQWRSLDILQPLMMSRMGDVLFESQTAGAGGSVDFGGVYRWDAGAQRVVPVAVKGTKSSDNSVLELFPPFGESINNRGEYSFVAGGNDTNGKLIAGLFLLDQNGSVQPVALDDQSLPGGDRIGSVTGAVLNDSGVITFVALRKSDVAAGVYQWKNGSLSPAGAVTGTNAPGGGTFAAIRGVWVNPHDGSVLIAAELADNPSGEVGLYRFAAGRLAAAVVPGQTMPDGETNAGPSDGDWQFSPFNAAGQVAFITSLMDGSTAAYLMGADGTLTPLLKVGATTSLGMVTAVGAKVPTRQFARFPIGLNDQGQVALPVDLSTSDADSDAILLLTPQ